MANEAHGATVVRQARFRLTVTVTVMRGWEGPGCWRRGEGMGFDGQSEMRGQEIECRLRRLEIPRRGGTKQGQMQDEGEREEGALGGLS